jgi:hypothetical protein
LLQAAADHVKKIVGNLGSCIQERLSKWRQAQDPTAVRAMELDVAALQRETADQVAELALQQLASDPTLQASASLVARRQLGLRSGGIRTVEVMLLGGSKIRLKAEYFKPDRRRSKTRRKKRGKGGSGLYPVLAILGIHHGVTAAVAGEVCAQVADSDSLRAAQEALRRRGLTLGLQKIQRIVNQFSARAVEQRNQWVDQVRKQAAQPGPLTGKRILVAMDGGRLRERLPARAGRRRKATGHRRYDAPWREPKLFTIYVLRPDGTVDEMYQPVYDGTLGDCEQMFQMLEGYLKALGVHQAQQLIFAGDGALWIWERVGKMASGLGLAPDKVVEVIDWCHAVEVLYDIGKERVGWTQAQRDKWVHRAKRLLHAGDIARLLEQIDALCVGCRAKDIRQHRDYFARNEARMQYARFEEDKVPRGSGSVESAIRRVINMRMKGNGMFWLEASAEGMLLLRSYLKSGHFDTLIDWSLSSAVPWWDFDQRPATPFSFPAVTTADA